MGTTHRCDGDRGTSRNYKALRGKPQLVDVLSYLEVIKGDHNTVAMATQRHGDIIDVCDGSVIRGQRWSMVVVVGEAGLSVRHKPLTVLLWIQRIVEKEERNNHEILDSMFRILQKQEVRTYLNAETRQFL